MRRTLRVIGSLAGLATVGVLLAGLVWAFSGQFGARGQPQVAQQPYPLPATPQLGYPPPSTPPPSPTRIPPTPTINVTPPFPNPILKPVPVPPDILADEKIAFLKDGDLQIINPASRAQARGTTSGNVTRIFGWSPDGHQLLLGVGDRPVRPESDMAGGRDLWVLSVRSGRATQLTQGLEVRRAAWSPAGDQIAYTIRYNGLHLINSDGTGLRELADRATRGPVWSPDGTKIAFARPPSSWNGGLSLVHDLAIANLDDGSIIQLTSGEEIIQPSWSMNGKKILFQQLGADRKPWFVVDAVGGIPQHLETRDFFIAVNVERSPVANQVAFDINGELWVMDFQGNTRRITGDASSHWAPAGITGGASSDWSPDGSRLVYIGEDGGLWVINADGTEVEKINNAGSQPNWSN